MKIIEAVEFLNAHPALCTGRDYPVENINVYVCETCKNEVHKESCEKAKDVEVTIYKTDDIDLFNKFKAKYYDRDSEEDWMSKVEVIEFAKVEVPYKEVYGYEWEFDHYTYFGECCFYKFDKAVLTSHICIKSGYKSRPDLAEYKVGHISYGRDDLPEEYFLKIEKEFNYYNTLYVENGWEIGRASCRERV